MQRVKKIIAVCVMIFSTPVCLAESPVYTVDKPAIVVQASQPVFSIQLKSNPTTGYSWYLRDYDSNVIQPVKHGFQAPDNQKLMGASGFEIWTFRVRPAGFSVPMQTQIRFVYARAWEVKKEITPVVFQVTVQPPK